MMIASEKSHQNISDYIQFSLKKNFNLVKKELFLVKIQEIQLNTTMILLTRSPERFFIQAATLVTSKRCERSSY